MDEANRALTGKEPGKLSQRVKTGVFFAALAMGLAVAGGWWWTLFLFGLFYFSFRELSELMRAKDIRPSQIIVMTTGTLLYLLAGSDQARHFPVVITIGITASFFRLLFRQPRASISDIGATLLGIFYTAYLPVHFILLRNLDSQVSPNPLEQPGLGYLVLSILIVSVSDIAAYYGGKRFGKELLYPEISPKKTREGAWWGLAGGVAVGLAYAAVIDFPWYHALILGILLVVVGQLGDLSESLLKRDAGLKDSGALLKGHGGVLDRVDSYIFSGAVCYYYIYWIVLHRGLAQDILQMISQLAPSGPFPI
jgi:phosphatidate cytidylyltransferase